MDVYFNDEDLEKLYRGSKLKGKPLYQEPVIRKFKKTIYMLSYCSRMEELYKFNGLHFEALQGDKIGTYSVRVDIHYRLELSIERVLEGDKFVKDNIHIICMSNHYS